MAIIIAEWKDNDNSYGIHMGGLVSQSILTVEDMSDGMLSECLRYTLRKKRTALYIVNDEKFPFGADAVLDVSDNLKDILKALDDVVGVVGDGTNSEVLRCETEDGKCRYLIRTDGSVYELVGYDYD